MCVLVSGWDLSGSERASCPLNRPAGLPVRLRRVPSGLARRFGERRRGLAPAGAGTRTRGLLKGRELASADLHIRPNGGSKKCGNCRESRPDPGSDQC